MLEPFIVATDRALRAVFAPARAIAAPTLEPAIPLDEADRALSASLMRVNHAGEIAAQALYHGQSMFARHARTRALLLQAAREETEHLAWCETRLRELQAGPSKLVPLWYAGSFGIGALAASFGDAVSLGFVAETERQVEGHLDDHLRRLPEPDRRSRAIIQRMQADEVDHGRRAESAGAVALPGPARALMRAVSRVMTRVAARI
ncbi:MAG: 2-polyprenyl-3-methyl-6-methoxy-1,4-benzoquinone monooxygenase [Steroidobacteraceae bacterium]